MRILTALLLLAFAAAPALAQDDRPARLDAARQFVQLTTADAVMDPMLDAVWPTVNAQLPPAIKSDAATVARLRETFGSEIRNALADQMDELAGLYADTFTLDDLEAYLKFYSSPAGAKLVANQGALMTQMLPKITARLQQTMPQAMQRIITEAQSGN